LTFNRITKGIGVDLQGCPIPYLGGLTVDVLKEARNFIQHYIVRLLLPHKLKPKSNCLEKVISKVSHGDVIVTFNYDVLVEQMLWKKKLWNPWDGYLIGDIVESERVKNTTRKETAVPVIKLHGSVNWMRQNYAIRDLGIGIYTTHLHTNEPFFEGLNVQADHREYEPKYALNTHVVLPTFMKTFQENWEIKLVQAALNAISNADKIFILGYSLPDADAMANLIFSQIQKTAKIDIVNPIDPMKLAKRLIDKYDLDKKNIIDEASTIEEWIENDFKYLAYEKNQSDRRFERELFGDIPD